MFSHLTSDSELTRLGNNLHQQISDEDSDNFTIGKDDEENDSIIIPDFSQDYSRSNVSNVVKYIEIPLPRRSSESVIALEKEEQNYTEDIYGTAKQLIFADLSLASWSNKDQSISSHSEFAG